MSTTTKKRIFQVFDEMNQADATNGTKTLGLSNELVEAKTVKKGTLVTMGCDHQTINDLLTGEKIALLLIVDRKEFEKRHV